MHMYMVWCGLGLGHASGVNDAPVVTSWLFGPSRKAEVHNVVWDPTYERLVLFSNFGFGTHETQASIVELDGVGTTAGLKVAKKMDLPCYGSEKWGGARPVDMATARQFWVSCGAALTPAEKIYAPAGLFSYDGGTVVAAVNGSRGGAAYDSFATWTDGGNVEWQFFVRADDRNRTARTPLTACAPNKDYCKTSVALGAAPTAAQLSARVNGDELFVLASKAESFGNYTGGCCADTLLVYPLSTAEDGPKTGAEISVSLDAIVPSDPTVKVSHTFFSWTEAGATTFNFAATKPNGGGDFVVEATLVEKGGKYAVEYVGHFAVPGSRHINGLTRFVYNGTGYTATTDLDFGLYLFADPRE